MTSQPCNGNWNCEARGLVQKPKKESVKESNRRCVSKRLDQRFIEFVKTAREVRLRTMSSFYLPFALAVIGMLFYHLSQKAIPQQMNPFVAVSVAYAVGIVLLGLCGLAYPSKRSFVDSARESNWAVFGLGAAAACIEVAFLLAYRAGWRISVVAVATNVVVTAMLVPIGILFFKDHLSLRDILGLIFCILGLVLVMRD